MALHVLKNPPRSWGNVLASSAGNVLSHLAEAKIAQMHEKTALSPLIAQGLDYSQAKLVNALPPDKQALFLHNYLSSGNNNRQTQVESQPQQQQQQFRGQPTPQQQPSLSLSDILSSSQSPAAAGILPYLGAGDLKNALQPNQPIKFPEQVPVQQQNQMQPGQGQPPQNAPTEADDNRARFAKALGGLSPKETDQDLKQQRFDFAKQESLKPFLTEAVKEHQTNRKLKHKAQEALDLLREHHKDWPGAFTGNLTPKQQALLLRNPYVRQYAALANEIVILKGQSRKGLPSNFKLQLEAAAKADLSQPLKTQEALLQSVVDEADEGEDRWKFILSQQDKNGQYPSDLPSRTVKFDQAHDDPLDNPQFFKEGTQYEDESGKIHTLRNGKWS